jgi:hypothetical protein
MSLTLIVEFKAFYTPNPLSRIFEMNVNKYMKRN